MGAVLVNGSSHVGIAALVRPGALAFGSQVLGTGNAQTVTVSNNGAAPMVIRGFAIGTPGVNANQFTVTNGNCPIGGTGLAPGASCNANVTFHPTQQGPQAATLDIILGSAAK